MRRLKKLILNKMPFLKHRDEKADPKPLLNVSSPHYIWCLNCFQHTRGSVFVGFIANSTWRTEDGGVKQLTDALRTRINSTMGQ
jgi:hypothetical protein